MGPWLIIRLGSVPAPPSTTPGGFTSLLGFWIGGIGGQTGVASPSTVGWVGRLRHTPQELERRLRKQRSETFGRRWFERYLDAQEAALEKAEKVKGKQREALLEAVAAVQDIEPVKEYAEELTRVLLGAAKASRVTASIRKSEEIVLLATEWDDDEEAIELLLLDG